MKSQPEPNFFAVLPVKIIRDKSLTATEKILFACITSLTRENGYCYASNKYFAEILGISTTRISHLLSILDDKKYIKRGIRQGLANNVVGTERKIFILIDTAQWGILGDSNNNKINNDLGVADSDQGGVADSDQSSFKGKEINNANAYLFRNLKEFFIQRVSSLKGISYVFSGGRDGNAIKQFLARQLRPDHEKLIDFYLASEKSEHNLSISAALSADTINQFNLKFNRESDVEKIWKSLKSGKN